MKFNVKKRLILLLTIIAILSSLTTVAFAGFIAPKPIRDSIVTPNYLIAPEPLRDSIVTPNYLIAPEPLRD